MDDSITGLELPGWDELPDGSRASWKNYIESVDPPPLMVEVSTANFSINEFNPKELTDKVGHDPVLAGKLLAVVNSARFGLSSPITSIQRAMVHLGYNLVKSIISSYMMEHAFSDPLPVPKEHLEYVRKWSAASSVLTHHWAQLADYKDPSTAATVALLSRTGTLVLGLGVPPPGAEYRKMLDEVERLRYEMDKWQASTPVLSQQLSKHWGIPEPIPGLLVRVWEPYVKPVPAADHGALLSLVAAGVLVAEQYMQDPEASPGLLMDSRMCYYLKNNLVDHKLLDSLHDVWASARVQRDLSGAVAE